MKAQSRKIGKLAGLALIVVAFLTISFTADASYYGYNRNKARKVINKTAYIIEEAYSIADYYGYWSENNISRAVYYNEYAQEQFSRRNYRRAIHYSLKARDYALRVIDGCDSYWDYYYYETMVGADTMDTILTTMEFIMDIIMETTTTTIIVTIILTTIILITPTITQIDQALITMEGEVMAEQIHSTQTNLQIMEIKQDNSKMIQDLKTYNQIAILIKKKLD